MDESGHELRAIDQPVDHDVLVRGMCTAADRAQAVERRCTHARGEVPIRGPADADSLDRRQVRATRRPGPRASSRAADALSSIGGRLGPPWRASEIPGVTGSSARSATSTRSCSATLQARTSTAREARAGTTLVAVPAAAAVGVTEVASSGGRAR